MRSETATKLGHTIWEMYQKLNLMLDEVGNACNAEEAKWYRHQIGDIMSVMSLHILEPLYKQNPSSVPPELANELRRMESESQ